MRPPWPEKDSCKAGPWRACWCFRSAQLMSHPSPENVRTCSLARPVKDKGLNKSGNWAQIGSKNAIPLILWIRSFGFPSIFSVDATWCDRMRICSWASCLDFFSTGAMRMFSLGYGQHRKRQVFLVDTNEVHSRRRRKYVSVNWGSSLLNDSPMNNQSTFDLNQ